MISWDDLCRLANSLNGLPVLRCRPGSPAALAGVRYGDILMSVNGRATPDWSSYIEARAVDRLAMALEIFRDGQTLTMRFSLDPTPASIDPQALLKEILSEGGVPGLSNRSSDDTPLS